MPKQTFLNLPEEKRRLIEEVAVDEFATHGFEAASISQIVSRAGIAKGSFYQYFEDKQDLFFHLLSRATQEKLAYFQDHAPPDPDIDFFASLRWMFAAGFAYAAKQSKLNQAVSRVLFGEGMFMDEAFKKARADSAQGFTHMIQQAARRGNIDPAIDPGVAAFIVETLLNSLGLFILKQSQPVLVDLQEGNIQWLMSEQAQRIIDHFLFFLENGLRNRSGEMP